jgi:hypothetical protein
MGLQQQTAQGEPCQHSTYIHLVAQLENQVPESGANSKWRDRTTLAVGRGSYSARECPTEKLQCEFRLKE